MQHAAPQQAASQQPSGQIAQSQLDVQSQSTQLQLAQLPSASQLQSQLSQLHTAQQQSNPSEDDELTLATPAAAKTTAANEASATLVKDIFVLSKIWHNKITTEAVAVNSAKRTKERGVAVRMSASRQVKQATSQSA